MDFFISHGSAFVPAEAPTAAQLLVPEGSVLAVSDGAFIYASRFYCLEGVWYRDIRPVKRILKPMSTELAQVSAWAAQS